VLNPWVKVHTLEAEVTVLTVELPSLPDVPDDPEVPDDPDDPEVPEDASPKVIAAYPACKLGNSIINVLSLIKFK
jgi:hypothetical protein